jgi:CRP/FNR family transcriptional regulator, anaerobic regulatory protein
MGTDAEVLRTLATLDATLADEMMRVGRRVELEAGTELLREGGYVRELPVVLRGLLRVSIGHEDKEMLLYYIQPAESCVMSFSALLEHSPSRVRAVVEQPAEVLLVPETSVRHWLDTNGSFARLMFKLYRERYHDLLHTVDLVAFGDLPARLLEHLQRLARMGGSEWVDVRHARLAQELGTAREVITRTLRKLEREGLVEQGDRGLRVL